MSILLGIQPRVGARVGQSVDARDGDVPWGTYHLASAGVTTWFGFASEIFRLAAARGAKVPSLRPIPAREYPARATRPRYSVLDTSKLRLAFDISLPKWQDSLEHCLAQHNFQITDDRATEVHSA